MDVEPVHALHMTGNIYDIGTPMGMTQANIDLAMYTNRNEIVKFMKEILMGWTEEKQ